jgi:hypothetical protein
MQVRSFFSVRARSLALAGAMLVATAVVPLTASAHWMGLWDGHWPWANYHHLLNLYYSRGCTGSFYGAAGDAAYGWNVTATPVYFNEVGSPPCNGGVYNGYVDIYSYNNPSDWAWGWAQAYTLHTVCDFWFLGCWSSHQVLDPSWNETYAAGQIMVNTAKDNGSDYFLLVADVTHEIGHTLGLAHAGYYNGEASGYYSIMDYLNWNYNRPQWHDVWDTNFLYPGW